jgi:hypothetical protein
MRYGWKSLLRRVIGLAEAPRLFRVAYLLLIPVAECGSCLAVGAV